MNEERVEETAERSRGNGYAIKFILGFLVSLILLLFGAEMKSITDDICELQRHDLERAQEIARIRTQLDEMKSDILEQMRENGRKLDRLTERLK